MLADALQDRAALFVAGAMTAAERDSFEVLLEYHGELRAHVARLQEAVAAVELARDAVGTAPPADLRARILGALDSLPAASGPDSLVVTDATGRVEWVNEAFTAMCGYSLAELRGRKPGQVLQGPGTEAAAVVRMREALRARRPCCETLVNYHKDGSAYRAEVRISPVLDDAGEPLYFVARERKLEGAVGMSDGRK